MKILILLEDGYEDLEFYYPYLRMQEEGFEVDVAAPKKGRKTGKNGTAYDVKLEVKDLNPSDYSGVFIPGGYAPDKLRRYEEINKIVREVYKNGGIIGSICHGPHVLISSGIVKGVTMTSFYSIKDDVINAGAKWVDKAVVVDKRIVTSRAPADLPKLLPALIKELKKINKEVNAQNNLPEFELVDEEGRKVTSNDLKGKWTVLYFFPKANTPGCTREAKDFSENMGFFRKKGINIIGVSPDSPEALTNFKKKHNLKVKFISDKEKELARKLGAIKQGNKINRSTFIINPDEKIIKSWKNVRVKGHVDAVKKEIGKLM
ncbi:MAG: DJ-1/PfpI/YhbO family deglycase/protease [Thermotogaceae bacterium]|nr:DJ-1/PfpI/YhbO family deglycase/protease [Thermotogaceae bacterium]